MALVEPPVPRPDPVQSRGGDGRPDVRLATNDHPSLGDVLLSVAGNMEITNSLLVQFKDEPRASYPAVVPMIEANALHHAKSVDERTEIADPKCGQRTTALSSSRRNTPGNLQTSPAY